VQTSRTPARYYLVTCVLLMSDERQEAPCHTDGLIAETLDISHSRVIRIKQRFVQKNL